MLSANHGVDHFTDIGHSVILLCSHAMTSLSP
jgi:hypothetical protein